MPNAKYFLGALELIREVVDEDTAANAMRTTLFILSGDYHDQRQSPGRFPGFFSGLGRMTQGEIVRDGVVQTCVKFAACGSLLRSRMRS